MTTNKAACLAVSLLGLAACRPAAPTRPLYNAYAYAAPVSPPPPLGAPLPAGWVWPLDLQRAARSFLTPIIYRPIDVAPLLAAVRRGPCAPEQVAPNVWITPLCTGLPPATSSMALRATASPSTASLPDGIDLRERGLDGPVMNQAMVGVCWSFAFSTVMSNGFRRAGRSDVVAPMHVLVSGVWDEIWRRGGSDHALTAESAWPYDPVKACKLNESKTEVWCDQAYHVNHGSWRQDPGLADEVKRADAAGVYRARKMEKLRSPLNPDEVAQILAAGQSVYVGMNINRDAFGYTSVHGGVVPDYAASDAAHALVVAGYRGPRGSRQFLMHNSWGVDWGEAGYAWLSEAMLQRFTDEAFTLEVQASGPPGPAQPAPVPNVPAPIPTPSSGCGPGQVRDLMSGACSASCAGGFPPVAGLCADRWPGLPAPATPAPVSPSVPTPVQPAAASCPAGKVPDFISRACVDQCPNGLPPAGGICVPSSLFQ